MYDNNLFIDSDGVAVRHDNGVVDVSQTRRNINLVLFNMNCCYIGNRNQQCHPVVVLLVVVASVSMILVAVVIVSLVFLFLSPRLPQFFGMLVIRITTTMIVVPLLMIFLMTIMTTTTHHHHRPPHQVQEAGAEQVVSTIVQ